MPALIRLELDRLMIPKLISETHQFQALSKSQSDWRVAQGNALGEKDLFSALMEARDPETSRGYTNDELVAEAGILIVAGSDTTATSLTATVFYLIHHSAILSRLQAEIYDKFSNVEEIRIGQQLNSCSFLFACIDEAMRLSPAVGALLPREILKGGLIVDGEYFPAGVDIGVPVYSVHHHEAYYPEPFEFKPERWLSETGSAEKSVTLARSAFCPFGIGRTACVGKYLAYQEMAIMLARLLWLDDLRLQPGTRLGEGHPRLGKDKMRAKEFQLYDKSVSTHDGPMLQFRSRL